MSINSSSFPSVVPRLFASSNSSAEDFHVACLNSPESLAIYTTYTVINVSFLPLYAFVLFLGFQQRRRQRLAPSGHSNFFTLQMAAVEVTGVLGSVVYVVGTHMESEAVVLLGVFLFCVIFPGQSSFHVLTCVERYLAVVHAVKYVQWSESIKVRVRNVSTASVWLLCCGWLGLLKLYLPDFPTAPLLPFLAVCFLITTLCCLAVLRFLRRPGPRERADQSKLRAFNMILVITVTLLLRIFGYLVSFGLNDMISIDPEHLCTFMDSGLWLTVPSSLVLPLLFLHKAGKLPCFRRNWKNGT